MRVRRALTGGLVALFAVAIAAGFAPVDSSRPPGPYVALRIDLVEGPGDAAEPAGEQRGSGVVIGAAGDGEWFALTNAHVVDPGEEAKRAVPKVFAGGEWRAGRVIASDADADLALVRFPFPEEMRTAELAVEPPSDRADVETHGFAAGRKYTTREGKLRRTLPLKGGEVAVAPRRYFIRTKFAPGESGGAVTIGRRLVALIHGNDCEAGWGICVDQPSIAEFVRPFLDETEQDTGSSAVLP